MSTTPPLLLHVFHSFDTGGAEARTATLFNALAGQFRHRVTAINGHYGTQALIDPSVDWAPLPGPSSRRPWSAATSFRQILRQLKPDLLLTYNWGAIDALFSLLPSQLCPAVHVEDGFGPDEAASLKRRRVWTRRLVLPRTTTRMVVPSQTLFRLASQHYGLPPGHLLQIPNGVDVHRFQPSRRPDLRHSLGIPPDAPVFGTIARLRGEKDLPWLVQRFAEAQIPHARLLFVGSGPAEPEIREAVRAHSVESQTIFAGNAPDPAPFYGVFDAFVMSSVTEQMPMGLLEAMASGLPALCTNVGDICTILPAAQAPLAVPRSEPARYAGTLRRLAADPAWRSALGLENRARAVAEFSLELMVSRWKRLYLEASGMTPPPEQQHEHVP